VLAGRKASVTQMRKNPLYRALRADKLQLACLESVLQAYLSPEPEKKLPVYRMLAMSAGYLEERAQALLSRLAGRLQRVRLSVVASSSCAGGGSLPGQLLPSSALCLVADNLSATRLAALLRRQPVPVIGTVQADTVRLDLRAVPKSDEQHIEVALLAIDSGLLKQSLPF